jgi:integrase/recombinase XerD
MAKEPTFENNTEIIEVYKDKLKLNGWVQNTIHTKLWKLKPFFKSYNDKPIKDVIRKDINKHLLELKKRVDDKTLTEVTYNKYIAEVKMFFDWLITEDEYIFLKERDLLRDLKFVDEKEDTSEKKYIDASDVKIMLPFCKCQRDRALVMLLWNTGCRIGELMAANIGDVNIKIKEIKVTGKTGTRELPITTALPDLKQYLNQRNVSNPDEPLFTSNANIDYRLTIRSAQQIVGILAKNAGITGKKFNCHAYRHGRITELASKGIPEMHLRLHAGWKRSSLMPETYIHPKAKEVKNRVIEIDTGKKVEETAPPVDMNAKTCYNCGFENAFDAKYCSVCSVVLDEHLALQLKEVEKKEKEIEQAELLKSLRQQVMDDMEKKLREAYDESKTKPYIKNAPHIIFDDGNNDKTAFTKQTK